MGGKRRIGLYYLSAERTIWTHLIRSLNALAGFLGVELPASDGGNAMKSASDMMYGAVSRYGMQGGLEIFEGDTVI